MQVAHKRLVDGWRPPQMSDCGFRQQSQQACWACDGGATSLASWAPSALGTRSWELFVHCSIVIYPCKLFPSPHRHALSRDVGSPVAALHHAADTGHQQVQGPTAVLCSTGSNARSNPKLWWLGGLAEPPGIYLAVRAGTSSSGACSRQEWRPDSGSGGGAARALGPHARARQAQNPAQAHAAPADGEPRGAG